MSEASGAAFSVPEIEMPDFVRAFALRVPRLGLFLGAGASVSSGIPSASQLVREFKRQIYAAETQTHPSRVASMTDSRAEETVQRYFDAHQGFPPAGADEEYSFYFERAYPDSNDRRLFVGRAMEGRKPHYGYVCLGALMEAGKLRFVWSPNFDDLTEQAFSLIAEGKAASVVGRDTSARLHIYIRDERFPIIVKVHGDFRVDSLQNTSSEVARCDEAIREGLVESCRGQGLVVVGYSGRDASVRTALMQALETHGPKAFPEGLYWCLREEDPAPPAARLLLEAAAKHKIRVGFVRIPDFDDFAEALYRACDLKNPVVDARLAERQRVRRGYELDVAGQAEPVLKLNAIPVVAFPERYYRFSAQVGSWSDLRSLVRGSEVVAGLRKAVLALGRRLDIESTFRERQVQDLQLCHIGTDIEKNDPVLVGMYYEAISLALTSLPSPLREQSDRRGSRLLFFRKDHGLAADLEAEFFGLGIRDAVSIVRKHGAGYWIHEAVNLSLEFREGRLWLLFAPTVFLSTDGEGTPWQVEGKADTVRELLAVRYNRQLSKLLTFWLKVLMSCTKNGVLHFPTAADGFEFRFERTLGVSYRQA